MASNADMKPRAGELEGELFTAADAGWDEARAAWNLLADQHPVAVAKVASADDVRAAIGFARDNGLRVAAQGTGHGAPGLKTLDGTLLIKTDRLTGIEVDSSSASGRVEAGVIWRDFLGAAQEQGLAGLGGSSPDVGVVGYTLGGGLGWLGRKYGLSCNRVTAIEVVTADAEQRRVDAATEPDLFWGRCAAAAATSGW
jgi:FAD/FMN-containing dehydrogenase